MHELYGQLRNAIDSQSLTDDFILTYFKTLVTGKAKTARAEFRFCVAMYNGAMRSLEHNFGQTQMVVKAHFDKFRCVPTLKLLDSNIITNYSGCISSPFGVFKSLSNNLDLKSATRLKTSVQNLPPKIKEFW